MASESNDALMIGVSGMRGVIGGSLTPRTVMRMTSAFAVWLWENREDTSRPPRVVFGRDSRPSGPFVRDAAISTLVAAGLEVIDLDIVTTPGVAMMVAHLDADAGLVATASHNPIQWNGLKFLNRKSVAPPPADVEQIIAHYHNSATKVVPVDQLLRHTHDPTTHAYHVKRVLDRVDSLGISAKAFKVVVDSVNGAGCVSSATLCSKLGCRLVHLNNTPDGQFPHEPEPTQANLTQLCDEVRRQKAAVGFAQDPDADRLAIVDERGTYIGEEYTLALCAKYILTKKAGKGAVVGTNLSTSRMVDDLAEQYGGRVVRSNVGEANVINAMLENDSIIGGEGNGGIIDPRIVPGRDSLVGIAYVLSLMAESGKTVSELVAEIPKYVILKDKQPLANKADAAPALEVVATKYADLKVNTDDGVRVDWPDGWVSVRASNTEPILRIISEAPTESAARERIAEVQAIVNGALSTT